MNDAVFISDLHLHPHMPDIMDRFRKFIHWASKNTLAVYILGDFLHVWPGDDALDAWSEDISSLLAQLSAHNVKVYFLPGNRDFLIGNTFLQKANMVLLQEPALITLGKERILLAHGDQYCTGDVSHQWLRRLTRNRWFKPLFLRLPYRVRHRIVNQARSYSQSNQRKSKASMDIVPKPMLADLCRFEAAALIHGHTHQPGLKIHRYQEKDLRQYTLSDWDENPAVLCYNRSKYLFSNVCGERTHGN
ncbi:MAG: UDP-2,3-diacylglucosamine diphosphatase [Legionella sp.]|nr:MAG: UDP-2,3-diacylglucosamine diphosphatase [Legionella sp.]